MNIENISSSILDSSSLDRKTSLPETGSQQDQADTIRKLEELLGLNLYCTTDPDLKVFSTQVKADHILYDMTMKTEPGITMPFFLLTPPDVDINTKKNLGTYPLVIVPHGHGCDGRYGPAGIFRHKKMEDQQSKYNHDLGLQFVKKGYIAVCPDARGAGDRRNQRDQGMNMEQLLSSSCTDLNNALVSLGSCLAAAWCWDLMRLIDLIICQSWGNKERIGVCGFSGGGLQSLFLSALDKRIRCTGISGYFFKFEDCILHSNRCSCNFIPSLPRHFDLAVIASLIAPSPLVIEKGTEDPLNGRRGITGPRELITRVKEKYTDVKLKNLFVYSEFGGDHRFCGKDIFPFFDQHLKSFIL